MRVLALLVVLALLAGCGAGDSGEKRTQRPLPDVTLASFGTGSGLDLRRIEGPAVLAVWASWCGPCRRDLPFYQSYAEKHSDEVAVIGIDFEDTDLAGARALIRDTGVRFPLYADPDGQVGSPVLPEVILVDAEGEVAYRKPLEITSVAQLERLVDEHLGVSA